MNTTSNYDPDDGCPSADHPAQEVKEASTGAESGVSQTDSAKETTPSTEETGTVTRTGNYHFKKVGQGKEAKLLVR